MLRFLAVVLVWRRSSDGFAYDACFLGPDGFFLTSRRRRALFRSRPNRSPNAECIFLSYPCLSFPQSYFGSLLSWPSVTVVRRPRPSNSITLGAVGLIGGGLWLGVFKRFATYLRNDVYRSEAVFLERRDCQASYQRARLSTSRYVLHERPAPPGLRACRGL